MNTLIRTSKASIVYGDFRGEKNQELFRCPKETEHKDLKRYVNEYRDVLGFEDDDTEDLRKVDGYEMINYFRMYYRNGWCGRWMGEGETEKIERIGVQRIIDWICENFKKGCNYKMMSYFSDNFKEVNENRYVIRPIYSDYYKAMVDTTYGNGDYPVRIYAYRKEN